MVNQGTIVERYLFKRPISFAMTFAAAHVSTFYWEKKWIQAGRNWIQAKRMSLESRLPNIAQVGFGSAANQ